MKKCPKCQLIVDTEYECKICGTSIVYEPYVDADREQIAKGYRLRYWLPKLKLPIAATVMFIIAMIVQYSAYKLLLSNAGLVILSWLVVIFRPWFEKSMRWKYSEDYAAFYMAAAAVIFPAVSILLSVVLIFIP